MNLNEMQSSLICKICNLIFERPVKLPCRNTICVSHLLDSNGCLINSFDCSICQHSHNVTPSGFHPNFFIQKLINERKETIFKKEMKDSIENIFRVFTKFEKTDNTITEHFSQIRTKIIQQKEILIDQINNLSKQLIEKTHNLESELKTKSNQLKSTRQKYIIDIEIEIENNFRHLKPNLDELANIYSKVTNKATKFNEELKNLFQTELTAYTFSPNLSQLRDVSFLGEIKKEHFFQAKLISCHRDGSLIKGDLDEDEAMFQFFDGKHEADVNCILISSDNQKLISGGFDCYIKVWDLKTGLLLKSIANEKNGENWGIKCMINSARSNEIIFGSYHNSIRILDLNTFKILKFLDEHTKQVRFLELLTNDVLMSCSADLTVKLWNINLKKCLQTITNGFDPQCLKKLNDSTFAVVSTDGTIEIFSSNKNGSFSFTRRLVEKASKGFESKLGNDLKVSLELNLLIISSKMIRIWSLENFAFIGQLIPNDCSFVRTIELLSNNRLIAANSNHTLELWCLKTSKSLKVIKHHDHLANKIISY